MEKGDGGHLSGGAMFDAALQRRDDDEPMQATVHPAHPVEEVFTQHADFVWRSLRRLGVPLADVDDALQEVFLVVYRRVGEYEDRGLIRAWLFAISRQVASHYHRAANRAENRHRRLVVDATAPDLEEEMARREAGRLVTAFLEELEEPQRLVFYLADIEGMTAPEIAAALGANLNTVYGRLRLARKRFERALSERQRGETTKK
jgi:RNA polymerase sigma-70 factor (ECF subfamily)